MYYGFATGLNQPWETIESPWANDLTAYRAKWDRFLSDLAGDKKIRQDCMCSPKPTVVRHRTVSGNGYPNPET
ncbi:hypothetical protein [Spirosoma telluris]|uniref:hypothetical protein n=1 Tax=Spirosoma telluris TaxID=2183553 RepID=UPI002FC2CB72